MPLFSSAFARRTIGLLAASALVLLLIVGAAAWLSTLTAQHAAEVTRERVVRSTVANVYTALLDAETGQRGYLLTRTERYLEPFNAASATLDKYLTQLKPLVADDVASSKLVEELKSVADAKMAELGKTVALEKAGQHAEALKEVQTDLGKQLMDQARATLDELIGFSEARVEDRLRALTRAADLLRWVTLLGAALITVFAAGASYTVIRYTRELLSARRDLELANATLEDRVAERTSALQRANDEIQRFAYIVSHDLRSPLVNIMGFTSELEVAARTLQGYVAGDETQADKAREAARDDIPEALRFIRSSTSRMDSLINAILKLSREGRRELNPEPIDLAKLFANAGGSVRHQLEDAKATLGLPERAPIVISDRLALEQVVGNVLDNAVKYLSNDRPGHVSVTVTEPAGRVRIDIADNGRGIAEQDHERIFELFRRAGPQDRPGEGIGLAHVRALVRRLGGDITVRSELGRGTTFRIDLPKRLKTENPPAVPS